MGRKDPTSRGEPFGRLGLSGELYSSYNCYNLHMYYSCLYTVYVCNLCANMLWLFNEIWMNSRMDRYYLSVLSSMELQQKRLCLCVCLLMIYIFCAFSSSHMTIKS